MCLTFTKKKNAKKCKKNVCIYCNVEFQSYCTLKLFEFNNGIFIVKYFTCIRYTILLLISHCTLLYRMFQDTVDKCL